jgi:uncharacterized protein DUF1707
MTTGTPESQAAPGHELVRRPDGGLRLRAADADRSATVQVLQDAVARGLLTHDEGAERMAAAFAARFRDELPALTDDLPEDGLPVPAAVPVGWHALGSSLLAQVRHDLSVGLAAGPSGRRFVAALGVAFLLGLLVTLAGLGVHGLFAEAFDL